MNYGVKILGLAILALSFVSVVTGQSERFSDAKPGHRCTESNEDKRQMIDEADRDVFTVKSIRFLGNIVTHDRTLRKATMNEGDIFTQSELKAAIIRLSGIKAIYPITLNNVEITLDRPRKDVEILFCVRQKTKR